MIGLELFLAACLVAVLGVLNLIQLDSRLRERRARQRHAAERETVQVISQQFISATSVEDLLKEIPGLLSQRLEFPYVSLELRESGERWATPVARNSELEAMGRWITIPLSTKGRLLGTMTLAHYPGREISASVSKTIQVIGNYLALAIERKLAEVDLSRARDAALESVQHKSEFLATMSHEIRTPLNGVLGMLSLLQDSPLSAEQREFVETARISGEGLLSLINDVLDFSKLEANRVYPEKVDFDLYATVEDVVYLLARDRQRADLQLFCSLDPALPRGVEGDPARLRQVLINLLGNALKFTRKGEVCVRVWRDEGEDGAPSARFEVEDSGVGIPLEQQGKLFEPFTQADSSTTRRYGGTGLGLAICKQLVEAMGGEVGLESELGKGTTIWFTLPLKLSSAERKLSSPFLPLERVLLVDGSKTARETQAQQLSRLGLKVGTAENGAEAVKRVREGGIEFLLIDQHLPDMKPVKLAALLREAKFDGPLVLMATSMQPRPEDGEKVFAGRLTKPLFLTRVGEELRDVLHRVTLSELKAATRKSSSGDSSVERRLVEGPTILVAEDNHINQKLIRHYLQRLGYRAHVVDNGFEVVAAFEAQRCQAILMDCQMPEMDGFAATRRIRELEANVIHTPIVAITANALSGDRDKCLAAGMDDYLSKPIRMEQLQEVLARWVPLEKVSST